MKSGGTIEGELNSARLGKSKGVDGRHQYSSVGLLVGLLVGLVSVMLFYVGRSVVVGLLGRPVGGPVGQSGRFSPVVAC
jgi:hypothetical protein